MITATKPRVTVKQLRDVITDLRDRIEDSDELNDLEVLLSWSPAEREWQRYSPEGYADEVAELATVLVDKIRGWLDETKDI